MPRFTQHPDLTEELANEFRQNHLELFEKAQLIATNNDQIVKAFTFNDEDFVIKRYPEKGLRANLRSLLGISRAMNSFKKSALLFSLGIKTPAHLFVARHLGLLHGFSYLIMEKSKGTSLWAMIFDQPESPISETVIKNLALVTRDIHSAGLSHGDLHAGNIFIMNNESIEIIDLDNLRPSYKKQEKDQSRLLQSFDSRPDLHEALTRALKNTP